MDIKSIYVFLYTSKNRKISMTTYTPAYKQMPNSACSTQLSLAPPPGSIMAYFGGGNTAGASDPEGWVIADGTARSNAGDGRYNFIANELKIGTIGGTNYTPPDLRGAFLRGGKRGATTSYGSFASDMPANGQPVSQTHATQTHNHGINDPGHKHILDPFNDNFDTVGGTPGDDNFGLANSALNDTDANTRMSEWHAPRPKLYDWIRNNTTGITINNSNTSVDANETRPYNFVVNWIIKL